MRPKGPAATSPGREAGGGGEGRSERRRRGTRIAIVVRLLRSASPESPSRLDGQAYPLTALRASIRRQRESMAVNAEASPGSLLLALAICTLLFLLTGCAKVGEPQPPVLLIPKPATNVAAMQHQDAIVITASMPVENTNGSPVTTLQKVEVYRVSESSGPMSAGLPETDFVKRAELIFAVTVDRLAPYLHDKTLVFRDEFPSSQRASFYGRTFDYAIEFVNRKKQIAGLSNQAVISPVTIPAAPSGLSAKLTQTSIDLTWDVPAQNIDGSIPPRIAGYNVYRSEDPGKFPPAPLNTGLQQQPAYEDRSFQFDKTYYYEVSVVGSSENPYAESLASAPVTVVARDIFPPSAPLNLNAVVENGTVILLWVAPPDPDVAGYRVYRSEEREGAKQLLQAALVVALSYRDDKVSAAKKYEYFVAAVDAHGNEGPAAHITVEVP